MSGLDRKNLQLLDLLQQDGRITNARLAEALSLSETPCWRRLKRLEQDGVISGYQATLDRKRLGLGVMAFVQLNCMAHDATTVAAFEKVVIDSPNILSCHNTTGDDDFLLMVVARDLEDYSDFIERVLRRLPGVTNIRSSLSLREIKSTNRLPLG
ncbi:Lrp/AsnC family transcriptional regulator [Halomonas denitrificans]|uniref:Lrp/AsnC family transcriptional regulator n=1 Tax=Halomonas TaxID=2745 RepID=UPI001A8DD6C8|nr:MULTISPECIES: Lrp/AsnC family transcriptional regulator [Halomonas]MBN8414411.1 Lrp/AsnC family transcriptional regulator [Halomonas litopenaei]MED5295905.1 Lrp/AsnC family transcriptional regulator [Pseudomonadota bacterium]MBY5927385.1 Lrp/AsnC family transcriptional regulator [Halomonas sp. DP4Y7-2]MBY5929239.1 Lrp/AsnC family transcriptional regulator [Halomonas sp. DP8Y7-3]MBY5970627.1 Lrp/AsnC family transcriptional regulator [Halomonas denitrificans]